MIPPACGHGFGNSGSDGVGWERVIAGIEIWANKESLPHMNATHVMVWLIPYVALGASVTCAGLLFAGVVGWTADRLRKGPATRRFQSLGKRAQECRISLVQHYDSPAKGGNYPVQFGAINVEVGMLLADLQGLGIQIPSVLNTRTTKTMSTISFHI